MKEIWTIPAILRKDQIEIAGSMKGCVNNVHVTMFDGIFVPGGLQFDGFIGQAHFPDLEVYGVQRFHGMHYFSVAEDENAAGIDFAAIPNEIDVAPDPPSRDESEDEE